MTAAPSTKRRKQVAGEGWQATGQPMLSGEVTVSPGMVRDRYGCAVMMEWEAELMRRSAEWVAGARSPVCATVLNVGFGLGLVDSAIQTWRPARHIVVEAHPQIAERAREWADGKPGVTVVHSMWQDADLESFGPFDGVYFDTYEETVDEFMCCVPRILRVGGRLSFFNGYQPQCPVRHLAYTHYLVARLNQFGFDCNLAIVTLDMRCRLLLLLNTHYLL